MKVKFLLSSMALVMATSAMGASEFEFDQQQIRDERDEKVEVESDAAPRKSKKTNERAELVRSFVENLAGSEKAIREERLAKQKAASLAQKTKADVENARKKDDETRAQQRLTNLLSAARRDIEAKRAEEAAKKAEASAKKEASEEKSSDEKFLADAVAKAAADQIAYEESLVARLQALQKNREEASKAEARSIEKEQRRLTKALLAALNSKPEAKKEEAKKEEASPSSSVSDKVKSAADTVVQAPVKFLVYVTPSKAQELVAKIPGISYITVNEGDAGAKYASKRVAQGTLATAVIAVPTYAAYRLIKHFVFGNSQSQSAESSEEMN